MLYLRRAVCSNVKHIAIGAEGLRFDSRVGQIGRSRQRLATAATFLRNCVTQALNRGDRPRHSSHASAKYRKYDEDFFFI